MQALTRLQIRDEDLRGPGCPIENALRRTFPSAARIIVGFASSIVDEHEWRHSPGLRHNAVEHDRGGKFMPGTYELRQVR